MKKIILFTTLIAISHTMLAQIFLGKECDVSFFSKSPIEDIEAHNKAVKPLLNTITGEILFKIPITNFVFKSSLMQEHFNENYMESDKYPSATFQGKINEPVDYTGDGTTAVTATGTITLHGVAKQITASGSIIIKGSEILITSVFKVHMDDYKIVVPALYSQNIPPDMEITVKATLAPFTKPGGFASTTSGNTGAPQK
jgi:hypothetical protein